jgi:bifunctional non-homologous end joining protein LigD
LKKVRKFISTATDIFDNLLPEMRAKLIKKAIPEWIEPMLATLTEQRFSREGWIYEPKLDGERCITYKSGDRLNLMSRNQKTLNGGYPELVEVLEPQEHEFIVDGEIVAFDGGLTSFEKLQGRIGLHDARATEKEIPIFYYLFDIMYLDGYDTRGLPLRYRKELLLKALIFKEPLRYTTHVDLQGIAFYAEACRKGEEGVMAKDFSSIYVSTRSRSWLKFKCVSGQEFVIGGYTEPKNSRIGFGALLVGYYEDKRLMYAGKVGTGFNNETLKEMSTELKKMEQEASPFTDQVKERDAHWVKPVLVVEVGFGEWTRYNRLRVPRFRGLRRDKYADDVVREQK